MIKLRYFGQCGFALECFGIRFYVDPARALDGEQADLVLCTSRKAPHMDADSVLDLLRRSPHAKVVIPKSVESYARDLGIPFDRMTTTDSGLRVEYFKGGRYGRVYSAPSADPELDWTPGGGYPHLGYLMRFDSSTVYHAGACRMYDGIVDRLRPFRVSAALLPIGSEGFSAAEAAQLGEDIGAQWVVPMAETGEDLNRFIDHMLGFRPALGFKVFAPGEEWTLP